MYLVMQAAIGVILCLTTAHAGNACSGFPRTLLQQSDAPSPDSDRVSLHVPINREVADYARNATVKGSDILTQAGLVTTSDIQVVTLEGAHETTEQLLYAAPAGQYAAVHAGVAAAGANLLAAGAALSNDEDIIIRARTALAQANYLTDNIRDVDILQVETTQFANLDVVANLAHDGTLVHYWQSAITGPQDNVTFADEVDTAKDLYDVITEHLEEGLSETLAILSAQSIAHNLLAAVYTYQGNDTAVAQQNIYQALIFLKAVRALQTNESCSATWEQVDPLVEAAYGNATLATNSLAASDLETTIQSSEAILIAAQCSSLAPSLAPTSALTTAGK